MKITYHLARAHLSWCKDLAMRRSGSMNHANTKHSKNCMPKREPWWRHFIGAIGELVVSWYLGLKVDTHTIGRGDSGSDFSGGLQVKASDLRNEPNLVISKDEWARKPARVYVLVWLQDDLTRATIIGFITRENADRVKLGVDSGIQPYWFIRREHLTPIEQLTTINQPTHHEPVLEKLHVVNSGGANHLLH